MEPEPLELPRLDPDLVADDLALGDAADKVILLDPVARRRATEIAEHLAWLRACVDPDTWKLVLEIDARVTERWADLALALVRYGFNEGRRCPLRTSEGASS